MNTWSTTISMGSNGSKSKKSYSPSKPFGKEAKYDCNVNSNVPSVRKPNISSQFNSAVVKVPPSLSPFLVLYRQGYVWWIFSFLFLSTGHNRVLNTSTVIYSLWLSHCNSPFHKIFLKLSFSGPCILMKTVISLMNFTSKSRRDEKEKWNEFMTTWPLKYAPCFLI